MHQPAPQSDREHGTTANSYLWAHDLIETDPRQLRKRRLRRIAIACTAVLVVAGIVAALVINLRDTRPEPYINNALPPHDGPLMTYLISAPADATRLADERPAG